MRLKRSIVLTLFRTEFLMVFRDRRVLLTSILAPLLLMPVMFAGSRWTQQKREHTLATVTCRYAVIGSQAEAARELVTTNQAAQAEEPGSTMNPARGRNAAPGPVFFEEVQVTNAALALERGEIHVIIEALAMGEAEMLTTHRTVAKDKVPPGSRKPSSPSAGPKPPPETLALRLTFRGDRDDSAACMERMTKLLEDGRQRQRLEALAKAGLRVDLDGVGRLTPVDLASKRQVAGLTLGRALTFMVVIFLLTGGTMIATDTLAGEKERGTLETLLTTGASRLEIVLAKHLSVIAFGLLVTVIQLANLLVYVGFKLLPVPAGFAAAVTPGTVLLLLILFLPVAALVASVLLLVSGSARSYKEAQLYFFPVFLIGMAPAVAPFLPGLELRSAIVLVPIANIAVAVREVLTGTIDWPMLAIAWAVTGGAAAWATRLSIRLLSAERLVTAADTDRAEVTGGPALFGRHVWRWVAAMWAVLLMVNNYFEKVDLRIQILVNLVGIFFAGSMVILWKYRMSAREALALRLPPAAAWPAVLVGVPGGLLAATGLFRLTELFIPVPPEVIKSFNESLMPEGISPLQLLLFLGVMPGVFEEILFRGVLLHGLRRRLSPAVLALVVGAVFGVFHMTLFRFIPTAALGVMFAAIVMLTGSIYPAVLWHTLNNATSILLADLGIPLEQLDPGAYFAGSGLLAVSFWTAWRHRRIYPGLRLAAKGAATPASQA